MEESKSQAGGTPLAALPEEVLLLIFDKLDPKSQIALQGTCHDLYRFYPMRQRQELSVGGKDDLAALVAKAAAVTQLCALTLDINDERFESLVEELHGTGPHAHAMRQLLRENVAAAKVGI